MIDIVKDYLEIKSEINKISDNAAAILVLADIIKDLPKAGFGNLMAEYGHNLGMALKHVIKESVISTESDVNMSGNLVVFKE